MPLLRDHCLTPLLAAVVLAAWPARCESLENQLKAALRTADEGRLLEALRTPGGRDSLLQLCDESPANMAGSFEIAAANMLQAIRPSSAEDRRIVRQASLAVLHTTDDRQVALGLTDQLLRYALEDVRQNGAAETRGLAEAVHEDLLNGAVHPEIVSQSVKDLSAFSEPLSGPRQALFLQQISSLAQPGVQYAVVTAFLKRESPALPAQPSMPAPAQADSHEIAILLGVLGAVVGVVLYCALKINWPRFRQKHALTNR